MKDINQYPNSWSNTYVYSIIKVLADNVNALIWQLKSEFE